MVPRRWRGYCQVLYFGVVPAKGGLLPGTDIVGDRQRRTIARQDVNMVEAVGIEPTSDKVRT